jgi:hypothetical protein
VFALNGVELGRLPMTSEVGGALAGDFCGDGKQVIVFPRLTMKTGVDLPVFGQQGQVRGSFKLGPREMGGLAADTDGDGTTELLRRAMKPASLVAYGLQTSPRVLSTAMPHFNEALACGRLSGASKDDIVYANG